jgi:hypothetical protein
MALGLSMAIASACTNAKTDGAKMTPTPDQPHGSQSAALELRVGARDGTAVLTLRNRSREPLRVLSHVDAGQVHLDWYALILTAADGSARTLKLLDARNESGSVVVDLAPDKELEHVVDVQAWAARGPNGSKRFAPGVYQMTATYSVTEKGDHWTGTLSAGPTSIMLP